MATAEETNLEIATFDLAPLDGEVRPLGQWVTTFNLAVVALDPYTYESSWILDTAQRVLENYRGADCRIAWLVAGSADDAREFLGPLAERYLTFVDPDRGLLRAMGIETLPAFIHVDQSPKVLASAEGWDPAAWRDVAESLSKGMSWSRPSLGDRSDPTPYAGSPL